jgi:hypothetical protein
MHQRSRLRNVRLYDASSVHGEQKWPILRIPCARNLAWLDSTGQIGFPNNPPQDRFETKAISERNDGPISRYHTSPDLVVARPLFNSEREIRISDKHDRRSVLLKFAVARLVGNEMHLLRLDPSVEPRVEQAVCRGQHLTRPNQCAGAVTAMTKPTEAKSMRPAKQMSVRTRPITVIVEYHLARRTRLELGLRPAAR